MDSLKELYKILMRFHLKTWYTRSSKTFADLTSFESPVHEVITCTYLDVINMMVIVDIEWFPYLSRPPTTIKRNKDLV